MYREGQGFDSLILHNFPIQILIFPYIKRERWSEKEKRRKREKKYLEISRHRLKTRSLKDLKVKGIRN